MLPGSEEAGREQKRGSRSSPRARVIRTIGGNDQMTARKKAVSRTKTQKTAARRKAPRKRDPSRKQTALARLERELPPTFRDFERRVRTQLNHLEQQVERAQVKYRRRAARLLRESSHRLGRRVGDREFGH